MNLKSVLIILVGFTVFAGCAPGQTTGKLAAGQWSPPMSLGGGKYMIQGWDTEDAINGANSFCRNQYKSLYTENVTPHTRRERASITFSCK